MSKEKVNKNKSLGCYINSAGPGAERENSLYCVFGRIIIVVLISSTIRRTKKNYKAQKA